MGTMKVPALRVMARRIVCSIAIAVVALATAQSTTPAAWWARTTIREIHGQVLSSASCRLDVIRSDAGLVTGLAVVTPYPTTDRTENPLVVFGHETEDGCFWPTVTTAVSNDLTKGWREIATLPVKGKAATRRVRAYSPGEAMFILLDEFRLQLGKARYGKISIAEGQTAVFLLDDLAPPATSHSEKWVRGVDSLIPAATDQPFLTRPNEPVPVLHLSTVRGDNHLIEGQFDYGSPDALPATDAEWAAFTDGNFWPTVKAEIANDEKGVWKLVGQSSKPEKEYKPKGAPERMVVLKVDLTGFRPFIGKYRYGRVVLETGESAVFELSNLLPPSSDH